MYSSQKLKDYLYTSHTNTCCTLFQSWDHTVRMSTSKKHT